MKKRHIGIILWIILSFIIVHNISRANTDVDRDEQISTVTLLIVPTGNLGIIDNAVTETLVADSTSEAAFSKGFVEFSALKPTLIVDSNDKWKLTARSSGFTGPYDKDVKDLMLRDTASGHVTNGFNDYKSLSSEDKEIASYNIGVNNEEHPLQYKILLDWKKDIPGTYEATVTYTLSTNAG
jgi:hypothetical protein